MTLRAFFACLALCLACPAPEAAAQTTDAYHALQVFPVVVDTASFAQRFTFRNPNATSLTLRPRYFPAAGTSATALTCPDLAIPAASTATVASLRVLCPALPSGSQFGFLTVRAASDDVRVFAGFSRVANPQGNGFSVEAFAAHVFTSATSVVNGVRRLAASAGAPAFQTNCFVGNLEEIAPTGAPPSTPVHYTVLSGAGATLGSGDIALLPGQMVRLLDVFAVAQAGDYNDAMVRFEEQGDEEPGILAFCTVQDNTSFGADFRVAKQELADPREAGGGTVLGAQDNHATRATWPITDSAQIAFFGLPSTGDYASTHLFYFRHPDEVSCYLLDPSNGLPLDNSYNLEMRLLDAAGNVVAGGNDVLKFEHVYLGDKTDRGSGASGPYRLEVEDADRVVPVNPIGRLYAPYCVSGNGHTLGERIESIRPIDRF